MRPLNRQAQDFEHARLSQKCPGHMISIRVVREGSAPNKEGKITCAAHQGSDAWRRPGGRLLMPQLLHSFLPLLLVPSQCNQAAWKLGTAAPDFVNLRLDHDFWFVCRQVLPEWVE